MMHEVIFQNTFQYCCHIQDEGSSKSWLVLEHENDSKSDEFSDVLILVFTFW
jgi:hypothetical protein